MRVGGRVEAQGRSDTKNGEGELSSPAHRSVKQIHLMGKHKYIIQVHSIINSI